MRIGLIAQNHRTGIGTQTWEFARNMGIEKVLVTDLSKLHAANSRNQKKVTTTDWFDDYERMTVDGIPDERACRWLLDGIDVLFVVETPLNWNIFEWARQKKVKTVLQANFEFIEHFLRPVPKPDLFLAPSEWNIDRMQTLGNVQYLPVPIATDRIKRREITEARRFVHIAGHRAYLDRNGTNIVTESIKFVRNKDIEIKVYDQSVKEVPNYWDLYREGDVLLLPRIYGGLSLQLQEAAAAGMPVVVTEEDPYAKEDCSITVPGPYMHDLIKLRAEIQTHSASPQRLGETIDRLAGYDSIKHLSDQAYDWAQGRSWKNMKQKYLDTFAAL